MAGSVNGTSTRLLAKLADVLVKMEFAIPKHTSKVCYPLTLIRDGFAPLEITQLAYTEDHEKVEDAERAHVGPRACA